jgi:phage shock protein PspC (stress-responsive transcriptional regulator)
VGLGENLVVDPAVVRLIFVLLFFARISGILIYLILWHLIAVAPE